MPDVRTAVVKSRDELAAMAGEWDALAQGIGLPTLSHAWTLACAENFCAEDDLHVITVRLGGRLAGIAPLVRRGRAGVKRLELIGVSELYEPSGLLYDSDDALDLLLRGILDARRPLLFSRIPSHSPIAPHLRSIVRGHGVMFVKRGVGTSAIPIASGWTDYLSRLSSRERHDLKRARRRAEESGTVTVRICSPRPDEVAALFDDLVTVESAGWKARKGSSLKQRPALQRFFRSYATRAAQSGMTRFGFIDVDHKPIAAQLSVEYGDRLWVLKIGYDETWRRCSPGWQLLAETMRDAFERQLKSYEFLGSDESWMQRWETERREFSTVACYPPTVVGVYGLTADTAGRCLSKAGSVWAILTKALAGV